jgi:hypothetical protein
MMQERISNQLWNKLLKQICELQKQLYLPTIKGNGWFVTLIRHLR